MPLPADPDAAPSLVITADDYGYRPAYDAQDPRAVGRGRWMR